MSKFLRFAVCACKQEMKMLHHEEATFFTKVQNHVHHHMNLAVLMGIVGLTAMGGLAVGAHEFRSPEVTLYREYPQRFSGGHFKKMD